MLDTSYALIFGGCCSNVFTLEAIVKHEPDSGLLITVSQFVLVTLFALPSQLANRDAPSPNKSQAWLSSLRLKSPNIPLERLALMALMFFGVNMLNNWAFAFDISVPMHIILRSFGSVTTLAVGWLAGKKYSALQFASVAALTVGVIVSAWADANAKGASMSLTPEILSTSAPPSHFYAGLGVLFVAQLLSAAMGIYVEYTYETYGRHWLENLFYTHLFGLLFSFALYRQLSAQFLRLLAGPPTSFTLDAIDAVLPYPVSSLITEGRLSRLVQPLAKLSVPVGRITGVGGSVPKSLVLLVFNGLTQVLCISGVNRLAAQTTAVTVTVVLNIRKLASFLLSCVVFGNPVGLMMGVGAAIVFASGAVYGWDSSRQRKKKSDGPAWWGKEANGAAAARKSR